MQIAIYGTGGIGSTFAFHLARHGHDVTVIARSQRLAELRSDNAIVTVKGDKARCDDRGGAGAHDALEGGSAVKRKDGGTPAKAPGQHPVVKK